MQALNVNGEALVARQKGTVFEKEVASDKDISMC